MKPLRMTRFDSKRHKKVDLILKERKYTDHYFIIN